MDTEALLNGNAMTPGLRDWDLWTFDFLLAVELVAEL
jgi:hypothetical protein